MSPEIDFNRLQMSAALRDPQGMETFLRQWLEEGMHTAGEDYPGILAPTYAQVYRALPQDPTVRERAIGVVGQALAAIIREEFYPRTRGSMPDHLLASVLGLATMLECPEHLAEPLKLIPRGVHHGGYLELAIETNTLPT